MIVIIVKRFLDDVFEFDSTEEKVDTLVYAIAHGIEDAMKVLMEMSRGYPEAGLEYSEVDFTFEEHMTKKLLT